MQNETLNLNGNLHVRGKFLKSYGISEKSINSRLCDNRKGKTKNYEHFTDPNDQRIKWIKFESIPPSTRRKFNLPIPEQILQNLDEEKIEERLKRIRNMLHHANEKGYVHFVKHYHGIYQDHEVIEEHARTHSVLHASADLKRFGIPVKDIYPIYCEIEDLTFPGKSLKSFYHKLVDFEKHGVQSLIHSNQGKAKSTKAVTPEHLRNIERQFRDTQMFSGPEITDNVNFWAIRNGFRRLSVSTVRRIISDPHFQNKNRPYRNGVEWAKNNFEPFQIRLNADSNGEQWQIDGSRLQIPYFNAKKKCPSFLHLFVIMDVHSRKIIGYSVAESEKHDMVIEAFNSAVTNCEYLPKQILKDSGSCFKHKNIKYLLRFFQYLGCEIRTHKVGNPRDKAQVERFFGVLQSKVLKLTEGYIGEGIRSKRKEARPNEAVLKKNFDPKNLRSRDQLEKLVPDLIERYNNLKSKRDDLSPNLRFAIAKVHDGSVPVSDPDFKLMFWARKIIQVKNSMIILSEGSNREKQFQYIIDDAELRLRLNLTEVIVCYNRADRSTISVYDINEKWIVNLRLSDPCQNVQTTTYDPPKDPPIMDNTLQKKANNARTKTRNNLFKQSASLDMLLVKTKDNE